jgi:ABC-type phosphate transport system auxiliary subunit
MSQLRDALDDSERQARDLEKEKGELRRAFNEMQSRLEKLQKSSKVMDAFPLLNFESG